MTDMGNSMFSSADARDNAHELHGVEPHLFAYGFVGVDLRRVGIDVFFE